MANSGDARRRWFGAIFLALALGMLIAGQTVLRERLERHPGAFVYFWSACFLATGVTLIIALLDLRAIRHRARQERTELVKKTWSAIEIEDERSRKETE